VIINTPSAPVGTNSFTWMRPDGVGVRVVAQPFHNLNGIVGDVYGGLWWIETPQADVDQWQLWHYDPVQARIVLRVRAAGELFRTGSAIVNPSLAPVLVVAQPSFRAEDGLLDSVSLMLDTLDTLEQKLYTGVFRGSHKTGLLHL
jgi:hypothetical protein